MKKPKLNPKIMKKLESKLKNKMSKQAISSKLTRIRSKHHVTLNAAAEILAKSEGFTVMRYLENTDMESLKNKEIEKIKIKVHSKVYKKEKIIEIAKYTTDDKFLKAHINEINCTYNYRCYTSTFILCRKVLENLIIHNILRKKYSDRTKEHRKKYFDFNRGRFLDFEILLRNLRGSSKDFGPEKKLVERICDKAEAFKDEANDMTHSLYHIVTNKKEIDDTEFQIILDMIQRLENNL